MSAHVHGFSQRRDHAGSTGVCRGIRHTVARGKSTGAATAGARRIPDVGDRRHAATVLVAQSTPPARHRRLTVPGRSSAAGRAPIRVHGAEYSLCPTLQSAGLPTAGQLVRGVAVVDDGLHRPGLVVQLLLAQLDRVPGVEVTTRCW